MAEGNGKQLGDYVTLQRGTTYKSALLGLPGPYLLGLASIQRDGGFRSDSLQTYGGESPAKLTLNPGDLYVSLKDVTQSGDLLGSIARVPDSVHLGRLTQDTVKLVFKSEHTPRSYIYWVLRSPVYREYCRARAMGTTNLSLSREDFLSFRIPDPGLMTFDLVEALESIERKIDLNRRMNETLEAIARTLFKSWFVDFLPVRAKMEAVTAERGPSLPEARSGEFYVYAIECEGGSIYVGQTEDLRKRWEAHRDGKGARWTMHNRALRVVYWETAESRGAAIKRENWLKTGYGKKWLKKQIAARTQTGDPVRAKAEGRQPPGLSPDLAALFPDRFQKSELGMIPEGWEVSTIGEEFNLTMGQSPPGDTYNEIGEGLPFYQGRTDFGFRFPTRRVFCTAPTRFAEASDTLVSVRAPVGDINLAAERCCIGRGVAAIRHKSGAVFYTHYTMHSLADAFAHFEAEGTVFGSVGKNEFRGIKCLAPPPEVIAAFEKLASPLDQAVANNEQQSQTLAELRDALLPRLLSGELAVGSETAMAKEVCR